MKKILLLLALVLLLMLGAALWLVWRGTGANDVAALLPEQTVAVINLTDIPRSKVRWANTSLAQIGAEPEMKAFLERPLQFLGKAGGLDEAQDIVKKLDLRQVFAAAVTVSSQDAAILVGFQFQGGKNAHDDAIKRLRHELSRGAAESAPTKETYEGTEITSSKHSGAILYGAQSGNWGFLSNNLAVLKDTLDRLAGRKKDASLAGSERYKKVMPHLGKDPDFLLFVQPKSLLETLIAVGSGMGAQPIPQQLDEARKVEAVGGSLKFDGTDLRDTAFLLYPNPPEIGTLTHSLAQLADKETIAYFDTVLDLDKLATASKNPALAAVTSSPAFQATKLPELAPLAFGPEGAFISSWNSQAMRPTAIVAIQVKDAAKAQQSLQEILTIYPDTALANQGSTKLYSFPALQSQFANPTLALTDKYLLLGVDASDLQSYLAPPKSETMEKSPNFGPALSTFRQPAHIFGYIDSKSIFERGFPMLRQVIMFGAAFMPGASEVVDTSKLPQTDTIARHLNPILYSQRRLPDGYLMESSGPITLDQAVAFGAIGGGAFFQSKH